MVKVFPGLDRFFVVIKFICSFLGPIVLPAGVDVLCEVSFDIVASEKINW